jgi:hypothetical protein
MYSTAWPVVLAQSHASITGITDLRMPARCGYMSLSVSGSGQMILDELDEKLNDSRVQYIDKKRADKPHHKEVVCT